MVPKKVDGRFNDSFGEYDPIAEIREKDRVQMEKENQNQNSEVAI